MSRYQIICRDQQWQLMIEGQACPLLQCDDRSSLIRVACKVAAGRSSAVQAVDDRNDLEVHLHFRDGVVAVEGSWRSPRASARRTSPTSMNESFEPSPEQFPAS